MSYFELNHSFAVLMNLMTNQSYAQVTIACIKVELPILHIPFAIIEITNPLVISSPITIPAFPIEFTIFVNKSKILNYEGKEPKKTEMSCRKLVTFSKFLLLGI